MQSKFADKMRKLTEELKEEKSNPAALLVYVFRGIMNNDAFEDLSWFHFIGLAVATRILVDDFGLHPQWGATYLFCYISKYEKWMKLHNYFLNDLELVVVGVNSEDTSDSSEDSSEESEDSSDSSEESEESSEHIRAWKLRNVRHRNSVESGSEKSESSVDSDCKYY